MMYTVTASRNQHQWSMAYAATLGEACWEIVKCLPAGTTVAGALLLIGEIGDDGGLIGPLDGGLMIEVRRAP